MASANGKALSLTVESENAADFAPLADPKASRAALPVDKLKAFALEVTEGLDRTALKAALPGQDKVTGTLQVASVTAAGISGVLLVDVDGVTVQLYFNAAL